jgi:hypothetical protein
MAAVAYKVAMILQNRAGNRKTYALAGSDVNAAALTFDSGATEMSVSNEEVRIVDMIYSAAGTDTSNSTIYINGQIQPFKILHGANIGTVYSRQFLSAPLRIPAGALIKIVQNT